MSKAPYDSMIAYISLCGCSRHKSPCFKSSLDSSNSGVKCLIQDTSPKTFYFNIKTQYKRKPSIFYVFCSHMASDGIITLVLLDLFRLHTERPALLPLLHRLILWNSPVTDISSVDAVCKSLTPASSFSTISRHRWKWLKILFFSDSGGEVDAWRKSFSRLPIRTIRNPIVKSDFLFSSITESHWSHWSVLETTDWEKDEWVQCFPLWSVTIH